MIVNASLRNAPLRIASLRNAPPRNATFLSLTGERHESRDLSTGKPQPLLAEPEA